MVWHAQFKPYAPTQPPSYLQQEVADYNPQWDSRATMTIAEVAEGIRDHIRAPFSAEWFEANDVADDWTMVPVFEDTEDQTREAQFTWVYTGWQPEPHWNPAIMELKLREHRLEMWLKKVKAFSPGEGVGWYCIQPFSGDFRKVMWFELGSLTYCLKCNTTKMILAGLPTLIAPSDGALGALVAAHEWSEVAFSQDNSAL